MVPVVILLIGMLVGTVPGAAQQSGTRLRTDFTLTRLDGTVTSLADTRGKVRIVNVWATWCPPCVAELPSLAALADSLRADSVHVYAVAVDGPKQVRRFVRRLDAQPPIYFEREQFPRGWGRWAMPTTWVIGPDDRVLLMHRGAARWDDPSVLKNLRALIARSGK